MADGEALLTATLELLLVRHYNPSHPVASIWIPATLSALHRRPHGFHSLGLKEAWVGVLLLLIAVQHSISEMTQVRGGRHKASTCMLVGIVHVRRVLRAPIFVLYVIAEIEQ